MCALRMSKRQTYGSWFILVRCQYEKNLDPQYRKVQILIKSNKKVQTTT